MKSAKKKKKTKKKVVRVAAPIPKIIEAIPLESYSFDMVFDNTGKTMGVILHTFIPNEQIDFLPTKIKMEAALLVHDLHGATKH